MKTYLPFLLCFKLKSITCFIYLTILLLEIPFFSTAQGIHKLWGQTPNGGQDDAGTIFSMDGQGNNLQVEYSFTTTPGARPVDTELVVLNDKFYGMTSYGGSFDMGVIFELDPATNNYRKIHDFNKPNGAYPTGTLTFSNGKLYGTTPQGGANNLGVLFEYDLSSNTFTKRYDFTAVPENRLASYNGMIYGTTTKGGINNKGVIFMWNPVENTFTTKIDFDGQNVASPIGGMTLHNDKFYGMRYSEEGSSQGYVYEWDPVNNVYTEKVKTGYPKRLTYYNGKFYWIGNSSSAGLGTGYSIYSWDPSTNTAQSQSVLESIDRGQMEGSLTLRNGKLYGAIRSRSSDRYPTRGYLFEFNPVADRPIRTIFSFGSASLRSADGYGPVGALCLYNDKFYGMTQNGGGSGNGLIFEWGVENSTYKVLRSFDFAGDGDTPNGSLTYAMGKLLGTTKNGGSYMPLSNDRLGVFFEYDPIQASYTKKFDVQSYNTTTQSTTGGGNVNLVLHSGKFYGMGSGTSTGGYSSIFQWEPEINVYTEKKRLTTQDGTVPKGDLTLLNNKFYATTSKGGSNDKSVIFEWDPLSNIYLKKFDFSDVNGSMPFGNLTYYNGKFYGTTKNGGEYDAGVIFIWDPVSNNYERKISLSSTTGINPEGSLILINDKFYGVTSKGGANDFGVIFEWDFINNIYIKKFDFTTESGKFPVSNLTLNQGKLYGMTSAGGSNDMGTVFEWDYLTNIFTKKNDFYGSNGKGPLFSNSLIVVPAPIANVRPGSCTSFPSITINEFNNEEWIAITDDLGKAVAEINANGNVLGTINTSAYINDQAVRQDGNKNLYLDRNLTITPQNQPISAVSIRLYITNEEFHALKNAINSDNIGSEVSKIDDIAIFKSETDCSDGISTSATQIATTGLEWDGKGYVLSGSISSFSTFYFAKNTINALPVSLISFSGIPLESSVKLEWNTSSEVNSKEFELERSSNGSKFSRLAIIPAAIHSVAQSNYNYIDSQPLAGTSYYRLKMNDQDGTFSYSRVISIDRTFAAPSTFIYPNPVGDILNLTFIPDASLNYTVKDLGGKVFIENSWIKSDDSHFLSISVKTLPTGVYFLVVEGPHSKETLKFLKQ